MQAAQHRAALRDQEAARGVAIEPVHEFEVVLRIRGAQRLDHAEGQPRPAVYGHPAGLVDDEQPRVLVQDRGAQLARTERIEGTRPRRPAALDAHGRQAHAVAGLEPLRRLRAPAIDPHLALAQHAVDMAARHARPLAQQVVVQPLAGALRVDQRLADPGPAFRLVVHHCVND